MSNEKIVRHLRAMPTSDLMTQAANVIEQLDNALKLKESMNMVLKHEVNGLLAQMEAIGAGGVSSQRITSADSDTAQAMFDALSAIVAELAPGSKPYSSDSYLPAHLVHKARSAIAKASGGDL